MQGLKSLIILLVLMFFTSCQVKEASSTGGLISGHVPVTNNFTIDTPSTKKFVAGEVVSLWLSFPFDIIVDTAGGNPRVQITIGTSTVYALYTPQSNLRKLLFQYTITAGENDTDGIAFNALELNGSTLRFDNQGVLTDCNSVISAVVLSQLTVDTAAPVISDFDLTTVPGMVNLGEELIFLMQFDEAVIVTGTPQFALSLSGTPVNVNYLSGSGTRHLSFSYTIASADVDTDGFDSITSPLALGTGSIKDAVGNDANLDFSAYVAAILTYSANVHVNGQLPYVISTLFPANGTYIAGQNLDFTLVFDRAVTVSGSPYLNIQIGSNTRQALYLAGSGTEQITFRYTAVPGDVDADGIGVTGGIVQNLGDIVLTSNAAVSFFSYIFNNNFSVPVTSGIILDAVQPQPISVARNSDATLPVWGSFSADDVWIIGQDLSITVGFNTGMYVYQSGGSPFIPITIGGTVRNAVYSSGGNGQTSLVFRYVVQESDLDTDGTIAIGSINLNGGVITDSANTNSLLTLPVSGLSTTRIDGVRPLISSVAAPASGTYSQVLSLDASAMSFTVTWSEPVNYSLTSTGAAYLAMNIGGTTVNAEWVSGNNAASSSHAPSSLAGTNDSDGITISSPLAGSTVVKDQAGNSANSMAFTVPTTTAILVDTTVPTITSMTADNADGTYNNGDNLDFTVTFSESVTVTVSGGYPRIPVTIGSATRYLVPTASGTATTHTFRYTILLNELDTDGITVSGTLEQDTNGHIRDGGRNNVSSTFTAPSTPGILVDAVAASIIAVTQPSNGTYESSNSLSFTIQYSEAVTVTGTPRIDVALASGTASFNYASGTGTDTLTFSYTITATDYDFDGLPASITSINLNGGTITDSGSNAAATTFTARDLSAIFITYPNTDIWVQNNFANMAPAGSPAVANAGVITTETCGTGTCRIFSGDDSLTLGGNPLNGVATVFIVVKAPASVTGLENFDLFDIDVTLVGDLVENSFDLTTTNADVTFNAITTTGTNHDIDLAPSSVNVIQIDYTATQNYNPNTLLIESAFNGSIGEVIAISGTLTASEKANIRAYLEGKY